MTLPVPLPIRSAPSLAFQVVMSLLNGSRDRGENQPVRNADATGRTYVHEVRLPVGVLLPSKGTEDARATYAVEILTGVEVEVTIDD